MICVAFPTIMDGLVLRWYTDERAFADGREVATAGRVGITVLDERCNKETRQDAEAAHEYLASACHLPFHPKPDVSRWATHRLVSAFSHALEPLAPAVAP